MDKTGCLLIGGMVFMIGFLVFSFIAGVGQALTWIKWGFG